jgi:hypothetical protein
MRRLATGFERLETRIPPASLLGVFSDFLEDDSGIDNRANARSLGDDASDDHTLASMVSRPDAPDSSMFSRGFDSLNFVELDSADHESAASKDVQDVFEIGNPSNVLGESVLIRSPNGISAHVQTTGLTPGHVYTLWFVVFNNPDECVDGCNGADLVGNAAVNGTLAFGAGTIAGQDGSATLSGHLTEGDTSGYPFDFPIQPLPGAADGLVDADAAEIHLVVRSHGEKIPGQVAEQMHSFSGGCDVNVCADVQAAIHAP